MRRRPSRTALGIALLCATLALLAPGPGTARDSEAPPGASHRWLPCEDWVMHHWLPFDEGRLYRLLGMRHAEVLDHMRDDRRHSLAQLGLRRGYSPRRLANLLVEPRLRPGRRAHNERLRSRALRMLTQGHLAQHVLYHRFHHPGIALNARRIFGIRSLEFRRQRLAGVSPAEIGARRGRSRSSVARRTMATLRSYAERGVRNGSMSHRQARRLLVRQRRGLSAWLDAKIRKPTANPNARLYRHRTLKPRKRLVCVIFAGRRRLDRIDERL